MGPIEQLVQPLPLPEPDWEMYEKNECEIRHIRWVADDDRNVLQLSISVDQRIPIREYLRSDAQARTLSCANSQYEGIDSQLRNGYPSALWFTRCTFAGGKGQFLLQQAIQGEKSFYLLKRIWPEEPSAVDRARWVEYLMSIQVCDPSRIVSPCPAGYQRTQ